MITDDAAEKLVSTAERHKSARSTLEDVWQDVVDFYGVVAGITDREYPGEERDPLEDATPIKAWRGFARTLGGLLRPRGQKWIKPGFADPEIDNDPQVKIWKDIVGDRMMGAINRIDSGSLMSFNQADDDLVLFGVSYTLLDENPERPGLRFRTFPARDTYHGVGENGKPDKVFRYFSLDAKQAVDMFDKPGDRLNGEIREAAKQASCPKFKFLQITMESEDIEGYSGNMPWASIWIDVEHKEAVREEGFLEFPWIVVRDGVPAGWTYGYSICMANLPDARALQQIAAAISDASEYALSPPLLANDAAIVDDISLQPDGITYYDGTAVMGNRPPIERLDIGGNVPVGLQEQQDKREAIFEGFMRDILSLPLNSGMSVPEIMRRNEDFARMVAPITDPLLPQYNGAIAERTFSIMMRASQFPGGALGPLELQGEEIRFEYENPISRVEDETAELKKDEAINRVLEIAGVDPSVVQEVNLGAYARHKLTEAGAGDFLKDEQQVAQERQQLQEAAQAEALPGQVTEAAGAVEAALAAGEAIG